MAKSKLTGAENLTWHSDAMGPMKLYDRVTMDQTEFFSTIYLDLAKKMADGTSTISIDANDTEVVSEIKTRWNSRCWTIHPTAETRHIGIIALRVTT